MLQFDIRIMTIRKLEVQKWSLFGFIETPPFTLLAMVHALLHLLTKIHRMAHMYGENTIDAKWYAISDTSAQFATNAPSKLATGSITVAFGTQEKCQVEICKHNWNTWQR